MFCIQEDCGGNATESIQVHTFQYGDGTIFPITFLKCDVPVIHCPKCGQMWTDYRCEEIVEETVKKHKFGVLQHMLRGQL